jgi:hypothetical protein
MVVEVKVGFEFRQELALVEPTQKHRLINVHAPMHQGSDGAFVGGCAPSRHQSDANSHAFGRSAFGPQPMERFKKWFEWPRVEGLIGALGLVTLERIQTLGLKHPFRLIRKQDGVAVEGDPDFAGVAAGCTGGVWEDQSSGKACF